MLKSTMKIGFFSFVGLCVLYTTFTFAASRPLINPPHLKKGDTVGLVSSGFRAQNDELIHFAAERLAALGLKIKYGHSVFHRVGYFSGTDKERAADINRMFADPSVKAIFEVRGGWGSNRVLPLLDYPLIKKHPKILIGFSDITSLLLGIHAKTGLVTFHGPVAMMAWSPFTVHYLKATLFHARPVTYLNPQRTDEDDIIQTKDRIITINKGIARGRLLGGNLTVLTSMLGSHYLPQWKGAILFVEDVDEKLYQIDRMMSQLQQAGVLKHIAGFIFGKCTECTVGEHSTQYGTLTLMQILNHYIKPLNVPAWYGAMIGHDHKMFTLPEGATVEINADQGRIRLLKASVR